MNRYCADTKTLLGYEEEADEPEYSVVLPFLFVGGAVCSERRFDNVSVAWFLTLPLIVHYEELKRQGVKKIVNVSNIQREAEGFECIFIYADDDQVEQLNRIFQEVADIIGE
jgi:hypothetical protein